MISPNKLICALGLFLFVALNGLGASRTFYKSGDTIIYYFRHIHNPNGMYNNGNMSYDVMVNSLAESDYLRIITPSADKGKINVEEYYSTGKPKKLGTANSNIPQGYMAVYLKFTGDCATFYPDGKKQSILHYDENGIKDGDEYVFYPNGKLYCHKKNFKSHDYSLSDHDSLDMECYDKQGNTICEGGNGHWLIYDNNFNRIFIQGPVKKGLPDGVWTGNTYRADSIKFSFLFKKGKIIKQTGFDKNGVAYDYKDSFERAKYGDRKPIIFLEMLLNRLQTPRDENGKKIAIDTMHISFIIEKDGHTTDFKVQGDVPAAVQASFLNAFNKFHNNWVPGKYFGIPFRTQIILPVKTINYSSLKSDVNFDASSNLKHTITSSYSEKIFYYERMIDFSQP